MKSKYPIILASSSPRRKKILLQEGFSFTVVVPAVQEIVLASAKETARANARLKAEQVFKANRASLVIGADTVVNIDDKILGKPASLSAAKTMLMALSNQKHEVVTAVSLRSPALNMDFHDVSHVYFKELSMEGIEAYFALCNPLDKAGAYNIDEHGDSIIAEINGSYTNIMGLPVEKLRENIKKIIF